MDGDLFVNYQLISHRERLTINPLLINLLYMNELVNFNVILN